MKKVLAVLLSAVMLASLASCVRPQTGDPKAAYQAAGQKISELKEIDVTMNIDMSGAVSGQDVSVKMDMDMQMVPKGEDDADMAMKMTYQMSGMTLEMPIYYTDGYAYTELLGQKVKKKTDISSLRNNESMQSSMEVFATDFFREIGEGKQTEAGTLYSFVGDPEKAGDLTENILNQLKSAAQGAELDAEITKIEGSFTIDKNGYLCAQELNMDMAMEIGGTSATYSAKLIMTVNNPGQKVTIVFPDFSDYKDTGADTGSLFSGAA